MLIRKMEEKMRRKTRPILCILTTLLFCFSAYAVDLKNEDDTKYEVKITSGASTTNTSIEGHTTSLGVCSECEIEVVGVGTIKASGSETVVIKDGKLSKQ
jgi:hypothetical protein